MGAHVVALAADAEHRFSKKVVPRVDLIAGIGVKGDAHAGATVKHRSRVRADPTQPNLRQVHLIHCELFDELRGKGFSVAPGDLGENITTAGIDLLSLPRGAVFRIGVSATIEVTGLRNPCRQIEAFQPGLLDAVLVRGASGRIERKTGIMAVVLAGGAVHVDDPITVAMPPLPHQPLERV